MYVDSLQVARRDYQSKSEFSVADDLAARLEIKSQDHTSTKHQLPTNLSKTDTHVLDEGQQSQERVIDLIANKPNQTPSLHRQKPIHDADLRTTALRIDTQTLDTLSNYVGDASMNRSQMREDVVSIKGVVEKLFDNVQHLGVQLRELEIEADSRVAARSNEALIKANTASTSDEFDPLEFDRYNKLHQLSRGLTDNLDDLSTIQTSLSTLVNKTESSLQRQDRLNRDLQEEIMQVRLVSFNGIAAQLRQVVRRTARDLGKDIELELVGKQVRMDKTILDGVLPALEHILRNCVDHGIETAAVRKKKNKPASGKLS